MTPDENTWHPAALKSNPPRYVRYLQIQAMIAAFFHHDTSLITKLRSVFKEDKKPDILSILNGAFIRNYANERFEEALDLIKMGLKKQGHDFDLENAMQRPDLSWLFSDLIRYKENLNTLLTHNSGWLEVGQSMMWYGIFLTDSISKNLVGKYDELDNILELLINPEKLSFSEDELMSKYGYPREKLEDIDAEWY